MNLNNILKILKYKFTSGGKYGWSCYGDDAFYLDFKNKHDKPIGSVVIGTIGNVYECTVEVPGEGLCYRWIDPNYKDDMMSEAESRGCDREHAWDDVRFTDLEVESDFLEKMKAIVNDEEFDRRVLVPLELPDTELMALFKMAHEKDMSFNEYICEVLENAIKELDKEKLTSEVKKQKQRR